MIALANATCEELLYRVILQSEARRLAGPALAICFQALLFGTTHYVTGFPNGWVGVWLTLVFGLAMGLLTRWARSVWPAVLVHALCDGLIITLVVLERE